VADRKSFLVRIDAAILEALQRWANDDLRSVNAQIEYVLRDALRRVGRLPRPDTAAGSSASESGQSEVPKSEAGPDVA
jgi:hypothetical protein